MKFAPHPDFNIRQFIRDALREDIGPGDHTSLSTIPAHSKNKARLIIKDDGVLAGVELAQMIFKSVDRSLKIKQFMKDGELVKKGDIAFEVQGPARSILTAERLVLNCMQRMSGIATKTHQLTLLCKPSKTRILDTRKTTPLFRGPEKWAVLIGGGLNHRFGLYDMILVKNNHIDFAGGVRPAIESVLRYMKKKNLKLKIEVEARNLNEVREILKTKAADRILLDNFKIPEIHKALALIRRQCETELSGGINERNLRNYASCGADFISSGALTHSYRSLDMSLTAVKK